MNANRIIFESDKLHYAADLVHALAHPVRLQILEYIDEQKEVNVKRIYKDLGIEQSITSQHLKLLRDVEAVSGNRIGKFIYYSLNYTVLEKANTALKNYNAIEALRATQ